LHSLPGSLGGQLYMNAGLGEVEISKHLLDLTSCKGVLTTDEAGFG
jgi:UDP-N-acetylenolpyruvoylglucosamine reductase